MIPRLVQTQLRTMSQYNNLLTKGQMSTVTLFPEKHIKYNTYDELTIYIKGFVSRGEKAENFKKWTDSHDIMVAKHKWGELAKGWYWDCGQIKYPYPLITTTGHALYSGTKLLRFNPVVLTTGIIFDIALFSSRLLYEYFHADKNTVIYATKLSEDLIRLSKKYKKLRVISHSLGCKLLMNAIVKIPPEHRPTTIHMLAPAIVEEEYANVFNNLAKEKTYVYYCNDDIVLGTILQFIKSQNIVGASGLTNSYEGVEIKDVGEYFKDYWLVHNNYNINFSYFINPETPNRLF
ncbi:MAG: hypothetical protein Homavirus31_4 [Homavirus sp.]|uniref:Uncharacterized protein n=1 Tax=Homavirus sp. TaxID=2487769 RepID=A0A3G5A510_9VIRU|nr:MAG: hypothetical protein Homavirus31_4 [Homavirus sp.]